MLRYFYLIDNTYTIERKVSVSGAQMLMRLRFSPLWGEGKDWHKTGTIKKGKEKRIGTPRPSSRYSFVNCQLFGACLKQKW